MEGYTGLSSRLPTYASHTLEYSSSFDGCFRTEALTVGGYTKQVAVVLTNYRHLIAAKPNSTCEGIWRDRSLALPLDV